MADFYVALIDEDDKEVSGGTYQRAGVDRCDMKFADAHGLSLTNKNRIEFGVPDTTALISGLEFFRSGSRKPFAFGTLMAFCDPTRASKLICDPEGMLLMLKE